MFECEIRNGHPYSIGCLDPNPGKRTIDKKLLADQPLEEQQIVMKWIRENIFKIQTPNYKHDSYEIKHILHGDTDIYLTNNQMKDAMYLSGFDPVKINAINWVFSISEKSPAFRRR